MMKLSVKDLLQMLPLCVYLMKNSAAFAFDSHVILHVKIVRRRSAQSGVN